MPGETVLLTRRMPAVADATLRRGGFKTSLTERDESLSAAELREALRGCAGAITTVSDRIDADLLRAAGRGLRVVANFAVGYDNIDLAACAERGVVVTNTPGVLTEATADLTWALLLATARRLVEGDRLVRGGGWTGWAPMQLLGMELSGATLGVVGAGRIGSAVARRAAGFNMRILYAHPRPNLKLETKLGGTRKELDGLLRESDIVTLHTPMRPENHHLLNARRIGLMKPGALLINTGRGALVDEAALVEALREGRLGGAGLDVYEREPELAAGLAELPNVVLAPHLGSATTATRERMARIAAENVIAVLTGREPPNPVRVKR